MIKIVQRVLGIILVLVFSYQQFAYANTIVDSSPIDYLELISGITFFIGVIVLIVSVISFFHLKETIRKQIKTENNSEKPSEEIEKKEKRIQGRFYIWSIILSITGLTYLWLNYEISDNAFSIWMIIYIILFIISFIFRLCKKKKASNIICGISAIIVLWNVVSYILMLIFNYLQLAYAQMIVDSSPIDYIEPIVGITLFIDIIVLIVYAISFFHLKATIRKQIKTENNSEKLSEEIEKKKNRIQKNFYIWSIILSIMGLTYLWLKYISDEEFFRYIGLFIIIFIISFIFRLCKKKKVSNIICGISAIIVLWNVVSYKIVANYNHQFFKYSEIDNVSKEDFASDVDGLINTIIKNNKNGKKVTLIYQNTNYTSADELKQILNKLNKSEHYLIYYKFDKKRKYIESIELKIRTKGYFSELQKYEGKRAGSQVKSLVNQAVRYLDNPENDKDLINIVYISETGESRTITIKYDMDNSESIENLLNEIKSTKKYNVEAQVESYEEYNIVITKL